MAAKLERRSYAMMKKQRTFGLNVYSQYPESFYWMQTCITRLLEAVLQSICPLDLPRPLGVPGLA